MRLIKRLFGLVLLLAILSVGGMAAYAFRPLTLPVLPFEFSLKQGSSLKSAAQQMQQAGAFDQAWMFALMGRMLGKSAQIKAGNYEVESNLTPLQLLDVVTRGMGSYSELRVIEGWTFGQFRHALDSNPDIRHDTAGMSETDILKLIGAQAAYAEGLFFPDTYFFAKGTSDLDILKRAYASMQKNLQSVWLARDPGILFNDPYQALILASIVEKETGKADDRDKIAAVFVNRLRRGMRLQTDPTVIYGLGEQFDGNLHKRDLLSDTPYNTYTREGLPPTPIALPGMAALQAAMHPANSDALYFVARGDGSSEFSATLEAHNRAVNRYQRKQ
jgi:UPF0755 protein